MWSGGKETGEEGEAVLLYAPSSSDVSSNTPSPWSSSIGGHPTYFPNDDIVATYYQDVNNLDAGELGAYSSSMKRPRCKLCQHPMHLLSQINAPVEYQNLDRTLYIFACNRAKCWKDASNERSTTVDRGGQFIIGGGGVVQCIRSQQVGVASSESELEHRKEANQPEKWTKDTSGGWRDDTQDDSAGGWGDVHSNIDDDWGTDTGDGPELMEDLEAMLTACEMNAGNGASGKKTKGKNRNSKKNAKGSEIIAREKLCSQSSLEAFARFELEMYEEPYAASRGNGEENSDDEDDDDDAVGTTGTDGAKIQKLLSKYLEEEEDQELLSALGGSGSSASCGGGVAGGGVSRNSGEKFERLPPDERAFLAFTDRIKRSPEQVARYAYGGIPLWSV